jgi:acetyl esterase/lipase
MRPEEYPPQEPFSELGGKFHSEATRLGRGIVGKEFSCGADPYQSVAVFEAARPNGIVLLFFHGGAWTNGYKEWMSFMAPPLNAAGITFVSGGYRLAPLHLFPAGLDDAMAALGWTHRNIAGHGGDPRRIFVGGHSAGGHYTSLMAVRRDWQARHDLPADVIKGCLPVSGVYYFTAGSGLAMRPRFLGSERSGVEFAASPMHNIQSTPPFLMAHGDRDFPHLMRQAEEMEQALTKAGGSVKRMVLEGCDHLSASYACGEANGLWAPEAIRFMQAN